MGTNAAFVALLCWTLTIQHKRIFIMGKGILLWLLGVPIPIIILLAIIF